MQELESMPISPKEGAAAEALAEKPKLSPRAYALDVMLDYARAMRTSPNLSPQESIEFAEIEQELSVRLVKALQDSPSP